MRFSISPSLLCLVMWRPYNLIKGALLRGIALPLIYGAKMWALDESHLERAVLMAEEFAKTEELSYAVLERVAEKLSMKVNHYRRLRVRDPNYVS